MAFCYAFIDEPWSLNYVVYRDGDPELTGAAQAKRFAAASPVASFVCEAEAKDYCDYRNEQMEKHGSDAVGLIVR